MQAKHLTLDRFGISEEMLATFSSFINLEKESFFEFPYIHRDGIIDKEIIGLNSHLIPTTEGLWIGGGISPFIEDVYLFHSAIEALLFYQRRKIDLSASSLIALGLRISSIQIERIRHTFRFAKIHTVFGNDLISCINDCKVACFALKKPAGFYLKGQQIKVLFHDHCKAFLFDSQTFSLNQFLLKTGARPNMRAYKIRLY